ncbi:MAG: single-stranded-DNA-specific exonuclease RecJ [Oscillospiraceae bacterium]|nr:single-stranded-DNA-specific exonuclease RecJ [Oscillospiraceae bacterium]
MPAGKRWKVCQPDAAKAAHLRDQGGVTQLCAQVLTARGIESLEAAGSMLDTAELSDPFLLADMDKAVERINTAIMNGDRICVWGDYDCDGVSSTVMLTDWLQSAGADAAWYIPTRQEGYGLREEHIRELQAEGIRLIITVDNGISAIEEAKLIKELGMELIITDHHRPGDTIPEAVAVVDPFRPDCPSPYKTICGAVVALKLLAALDGGDCEMTLEQFGDLAALATIADVMPLTGENRYIVQRGLELLANTERMGLISLIAVCGIPEGEPITSTMAAFQLIPRINAAGRFASASLAAKLFLTDDPDEAQMLATQIHGLNDDRKAAEQEIFNEILDVIRREPALLCNRVLVFSGEDWHHGVIGIVAARLQERFGKPCFLMSRDGSDFRGSARSFGDFSVFDCLHACADYLVRYGGHPGAGGFTVSGENLDAFKAAIQTYAAEHNPQMPVMEITAETAVEPRDLTVQNVEGLRILEPYGAGNPKPLFVLLGVTVADVYPMSGGAHTKLRLRKNNVQLEALMFRISPEETGISPNMTVDLLVAAEIRPYMGKDSLTVRVEDWRVSEKAQEQSIAALAAYDSYIRGEQLPAAFYQRICPHRQDLVNVYKLVLGAKGAPVTLTRLCARLAENGMNLCRMRVCADIFRELELLQYDAAADTLAAVPVTQKRDLTDSAAYQKILAIVHQNQ